MGKTFVLLLCIIVLTLSFVSCTRVVPPFAKPDIESKSAAPSISQPELPVVSQIKVPQAMSNSIYSYRWLPDGSGMIMADQSIDGYRLYEIGLENNNYTLPHESGYLTHHVYQWDADIDITRGGDAIAFVSADLELSIYDIVQATAISVKGESTYGYLSMPIFSPDGQMIAFVEKHGAEDSHSDGINKIFVYDRESGAILAINSVGYTQIPIGFSYDSTKLYILGTFEGYNHSRNFRYDLWVVDPAYDEYTRLSSDGPIHNYLSSSQDPTSSGFVYGEWEEKDVDLNLVAVPTDIYFVSPEPFRRTKLTSTGRNAHPVYSPDGSRIAYVSDSLGNGEQWEVYTMARDGSDIKQLTFTNQPKIYPQWSPDGTMISFIQIEDAIGCLYVLNADGTGLRCISRSER